MANSNEEFVQSLNEEYPDMDWNNIPDLDSKPGYYKVEGMIQHRLHFTQSHRDIITNIGIGFGPYKTREEAEKYLEVWSNKYKYEILDDDSDLDSPIPHVEYLGPIVRLNINYYPDDELSYLHFCKSMLDDIKNGKKVFPLSLP